MEFLDKEERRAKTVRLFLGYGLVIFIIFTTTFMLSFVLQGFDIFNPKEVVRNGMLFMESSPVGAKISLNGIEDKDTNARLVLPEGLYDVQLSREGFRDWNKTIEVIGGTVVYHVYPRLYPSEIRTFTSGVYTKAPAIWSQSPDKRWIISSKLSGGVYTSLLLYDTTKPKVAPKPLELPASLFTETQLTKGTLSIIEWADDSRHILAKVTIPSASTAYVLIDKDRPQSSVNVTNALNMASTSELQLRSGKWDQYYVWQKSSGTLQRATLRGGIEPLIVADNVVAYKTYENSLILYATTAGATKNTYSVGVLDGSKTYSLQPISRGNSVVLALGRYEGSWIYAVGSSGNESIGVYFNPLSNGATIADGVIQPQMYMQLENAKSMAFSENERFVGVQSATAFAVYDAEAKRIYSFDSPVSLPKNGATWLDGHHYHVVSGGYEYVFEYDGANVQKLVPATNGLRAFYDKDFMRTYTIATNTSQKLSYTTGLLTLDEW